MSKLPTVAIINTSPDAVDMLRIALENAGFIVVTAFTHEIRDGGVDLDSFIRTHKPSVISYDIAPPYVKNFRLFEHIRSREFMKGIQFVITAMNPVHVQNLVGSDERVYEVVDRDEDLDRWIQAVKHASRSRPVR